MADAHRLVLRIVEPQAAGDLFGAPRRGPSSVLPGPVTAALPRHGRPVNRRPVWGDDPGATHEGFWSSPQESEGDLTSIQSLIF